MTEKLKAASQRIAARVVAGTVFADAIRPEMHLALPARGAVPDTERLELAARWMDAILVPLVGLGITPDLEAIDALMIAEFEINGRNWVLQREREAKAMMAALNGWRDQHRGRTDRHDRRVARGRGASAGATPELMHGGCR